jgi:hypothetical protein
MDGLDTYSVGNFIPFMPESYFRLFERQFEALWPLHLLLLVLGILVMVAAWLGKGRAVAVIMAGALAVVALSFHFRLYAELTPVGRYFGWAFLVQGFLMLLWGFFGRFDKPRRDLASWIGIVLAGFGVVVYPLLAISTGRGGKAAEYFGMAPDPTVCALLGMLIILARPLWLLLLLPVPLFWCVVSGATLRALDAPFGMLLPAIAGVAVVAGVITLWRRV